MDGREPYSWEDIYAFLAQALGVEQSLLTADTSLVGDPGVDGDDFSELLDAYMTRFAVDMSGYRWYFHQHSEGSDSFGELFFPERMRLIPVTPQILLASANAGRWQLEYPAKRPRTLRWNAIGCVLLMQIIGVAPPLVMRLITQFFRFAH